MKLKLFLSIICLSLFSLKAFAFAKTPVAQDSNAIMQESMNAMNAMKELALTGNPDVDFFTAMIPHHKGAIVMSEMMEKNISERSLKKLAESIIKNQKAEVTSMEEWLSKNPAKPEDKLTIANSEKMMLEAVRAMTAMHMAKMTGNADTDFVLGMVPHHKAAVKMAETILPFLKDQQVIKFANDVIAVQNQEIQQMEMMADKAKQS